MKTTSFFLFLMCFVAFESCKKTDEPAPSSTAYTLTISNGEGSGTYKTGDSVYVFSNAANATQVFDKWTGDVSALVNPNEFRAVAKMPSANVQLTATYKTIPAIEFTNVVINGSQVYYYVPTTYRGIILPFHGLGGNATGWTKSNLENLEFCKYAAANGRATALKKCRI